MEIMLKNLTEIENWIDNAPDPSMFRSNNDFMEFAVELMNRCLYLLRVGVSLAPTEETAERGYSKQRAIIMGHMIRIAKLYEGVLIHTSKCQLELAAIFIRLIFETAMRMEYMIKSKSKRKTIRSFILASYRPEREMLADLNSIASSRPLIQIEKRIKRKIEARLRKDGISTTELMSNKIWNVDGKDFRRILDTLGIGAGYSYMFGNGSHFVHGDWYEISQHHIKREGQYYTPELSYDDPDPRLACSLTTLCLDALLIYLKWSKSDPHRIVSPVVSRLIELNGAVDTAHENMLGA